VNRIKILYSLNNIFSIIKHSKVKL